jgi:hypothetical protein
MAVITHRLTGPGHMDNVSNVFWEENVVNTSIAVGSIPIGVAGWDGLQLYPRSWGVYWVTVFLPPLVGGRFYLKTPCTCDHSMGIRFVTKSIAFQKCGIHVPHYEGSAWRIAFKYVADLQIHVASAIAQGHIVSTSEMNKRCSNGCKSFHKPAEIVCKTKKGTDLCDISWCLPLLNCLDFLGSTLSPSTDTMCPRNSTFWVVQVTFGQLGKQTFRHCSRSVWRTSCRYCLCSSADWEKTRMSSMYTTTNLPMYGAKILFMVDWNVAGAFVRPKHNTSNSYCPNGVLNAVFGTSSGVMRIWW